MSAYPNAQSISGLEQLIEKLRKTLPKTVDAKLLKSFNIAPNNEPYVLGTLKFLGLLGEDNKPTDDGESVFHSGSQFEQSFRSVIKSAYQPLFDIHGEDTWILSQDQLMQFFRVQDKSSELVGKRKAQTFGKLAEIAGMRSGSLPNGGNKPSTPKSMRKASPAKRMGGQEEARVSSPSGSAASVSHDVALAVRIEVILPQTTDQATYDAIFRSIRENLIVRD